MRLSDAILMGDSLKKCDPGIFIEPFEGRGCAIGGALLAQGMTANEWLANPTTDIIRKYWPWLTDEQRSNIGIMYDSVAEGESTIEQLVDYVRSVEPAEEPEPEELPEEAYWSDSDTTREMMNSIKGR